MSDLMQQCTCCGDLLLFPADVPVRCCPACGTPNARAKVGGSALECLRHATRQRLGNDFDNAERSYQQVLLEHPDSHEALWGRLLCHYGVEYITDPATGQPLPTLHNLRQKPLRLQPEYRDACTFAPADVRARYEQDAAFIDDAQAAIRERVDSCPPYDVYLCHLSAHSGDTEQTVDFRRARQISDLLSAQGIRTFLAPVELAGLTGPQHEAGLVHALGTARLMLVVCSDADSLASPVMRSEWSRFLENMDEDENKQLVPLLFDRMGNDALPEEFRFRHLSSFVMGGENTPSRLMALVCTALGRSLPAKAQPAPTQPAQPKPTQTASPQQPATMQPRTVRVNNPPPAPAQPRTIRVNNPPTAPSQPRTVRVNNPPPAPAQPRTVRVNNPPDASAQPRTVRVNNPPKPATPPVKETFSTQSVSGGCIITAYNGPGGSVYLPGIMNGETVLGVGHKAFYLCETLRKVTLPDGVTEIGDFAFAGCKNLESIQLPRTMRTLGSHAFFMCDALTQILLPEELEAIGASAFLNCSKLQSVNIPHRIEIGQGAFDGCSQLPQRTKQEIAAHSHHKGKSGFRR